MSGGLKNQQRCPDKLELQDTCSSSWLQSLLLPQTYLFSHGTAVFTSVVHLPTRPTTLSNCTFTSNIFQLQSLMAVPNRFLWFLLLSSALEKTGGGVAELCLGPVVSLSQNVWTGEGQNHICSLAEVLPVGHRQKLTTRV